MVQRVLSLSHNDLDGIFSSIIVNQAFNLIELPIFSSYRKLSENLDYVTYLAKKERADIVFITDLHLSTPEFQQQVNELAKVTKVIIIDHHYCIKSDLDKLQNPNIIYYFDQSVSATKLTHKTLSQKFDLIKWTELVERVNAFDIWDNNSLYFKFGLALNDLVWTYNSPIKVFNKFKNGIKSEDKTNLLNELSEIIDKRNKHLKKLEDKKLLLFVKDFCISFTDDFVHHIQLRYPGYKYYINVTSYNNITFKVTENSDNYIINNGINSFQNYLLSISVEINNMGGHENILSVSLNNITPKGVVDIIKHFVQNYYNIQQRKLNERIS